MSVRGTSGSFVVVMNVPSLNDRGEGLGRREIEEVKLSVSGRPVIRRDDWP